MVEWEKLCGMEGVLVSCVRSFNGFSKFLHHVVNYIYYCSHVYRKSLMNYIFFGIDYVFIYLRTYVMENHMLLCYRSKYVMPPHVMLDL